MRQGCYYSRALPADAFLSWLLQFNNAAQGEPQIYLDALVGAA